MRASAASGPAPAVSARSAAHSADGRSRRPAAADTRPPASSGRVCAVNGPSRPAPCGWRRGTGARLAFCRPPGPTATPAAPVPRRTSRSGRPIRGRRGRWSTRRGRPPRRAARSPGRYSPRWRRAAPSSGCASRHCPAGPVPPPPPGARRRRDGRGGRGGHRVRRSRSPSRPPRRLRHRPPPRPRGSPGGPARRLCGPVLRPPDHRGPRRGRGRAGAVRRSIRPRGPAPPRCGVGARGAIWDI